MTMAKQMINPRAYMRDRLRALCGEITPGKRLIFVILAILLMGFANLYAVFNAVYRLGRKSGERDRLKIENIKGLEFKQNKSNPYEKKPGKEIEGEG